MPNGLCLHDVYGQVVQDGPIHRKLSLVHHRWQDPWQSCAGCDRAPDCTCFVDVDLRPGDVRRYAEQWNRQVFDVAAQVTLGQANHAVAGEGDIGEGVIVEGLAIHEGYPRHGLGFVGADIQRDRRALGAPMLVPPIQSMGIPSSIAR